MHGGDMRAALLHSAPTIGSTPAERYLALSIAGATAALYITNSYFVPDDDFCELLDARGEARRGRARADGRRATDVKSHAGTPGARDTRSCSSGGVRIFEYQPAMMHAKTFVVDGLLVGDRHDELRQPLARVQR